MKQFLKQSFYTLAGLPLIYHLGNPWRGRACVLCYHRVLPDDEIERGKSPNSCLIMPATRFSEQMEFLAKNYKVVSINELVEHLEGNSNRFVVAVTFDDGYKDNLNHALPILEKYNIPATIYITTRFPEGDTSMWWYEIWDFLTNVESLKVNYLGRYESWNTRSFEENTGCFEQLRDWILSFGYSQQLELMEAITSSSDRKQYLDLCLSWSEVFKLDQHPLITIGAHTHSHPNLRHLTKENARSEILFSKRLLEEKLSHSIEHFAYPFGTKNEADVREFELVNECNFKSAVTTRRETIQSYSLNSIPRLSILPSINRQCFKGMLSGWEHLTRDMLSVPKSRIIAS